MTDRGGSDGNLAAALIVHYALGFFWLFALGGGGSELLHPAVGVTWALCAVPLWIVDSVRMVRAKAAPGRVWALTFGWWLKTFLSPLFLGIEILGRFPSATAQEGRPIVPATPSLPSLARASSPPPPIPPEPTSDLLRRVEDFARRLGALERELGDLRRAVSAAAPTATPVPVPPPPTPAPQPVVPPPPPAPTPAPVAIKQPLSPAAPPAPKEPAWWTGLTFADLFTAKVLAWAGGVVTLLGVLFFFVLAVNRGWIGPVARVSLGAIASALVFSAGLFIRRRYGQLYYSAYAAVGAGIGGGYATLLAARLRYDLVSDWSALVIALVIAGVGTATALAWSSELIAGLGMIGALLAPAAVGLQSGELTAAGTGFAVLVFAGTAIVAVGRRWQALLGIGVAAALPQGAILIAQSEPTDSGVVAVTALLWLLVLGSAIALQLRFESPNLAALPASLTLVSAVFAGLGVAAQFTGHDEGWMLLAVAAPYAALAGLFQPRWIHRDLSALLAAVGLAVVAVALADLVSGPTLAVAWAAEAAVLAWLARRIDELRYQIAALAYLAAALVHALFLDAPLDQLYRPTEHPAAGFVAFVGLAVACAIFGYYARPWETARLSAGILAPLQSPLDAFRVRQPLWRSLSGWTAALSIVYVGSLGILELEQWLDGSPDIRSAFDWGHVGVTALWAAASLATLAVGHRLRSREILLGGIAGSLGVVAQVVLFDTSLPEDPRRACFLILAPTAAALAVMGRRIGEPLCHAAALASLLPLPVFAVADAPPDRLYRAFHTPLANPELTALLAFVVAAAIVAWNFRLDGAAAVPKWFSEDRETAQSIVGWSAALGAIYAASLGVLQVAQEFRGDDVRPAFEWGSVVVIALWSLVAITVLAAGHRWSFRQLRIGGLVWLGATLAQTLGLATSFDRAPRVTALVVAAATLLVGCLVDRLQRRERQVFPVIAVYALFSIGLAAGAAADITGQDRARGLALVGIAILYCAIAALVFRRDRDLSTVLWAPALYLAMGASDLLLSGTWLVLAWSAISVAALAVADRAGEMRLQIASLAYLLVAAGHALILDGPPRDFLESNGHPAGGVASLFIVAGATAAFALYCERASAGPPPADSQGIRAALARREPLWERISIASAAVLLLYAASLAILGIAEEIGTGTVAAKFHAGHSGVSAMWGLVGLVALYVGLRKRVVWLQAIGFGLFAVSLAKIFLYDLRFLSSVTRALSFLAVGAVLLLGGFFVQKLGAERDAKPA
jgi:uncharacterized membrane protein